LGHRWAETLHPDELERCREIYETAFETRQPFEVEHRLLHRDGDYRWAVTIGVPRYDGAGTFAGYIGTAADITERKLAEEALSSVSRRLIDAHEEERTRIARELHDDINQRLALVSLRLSSGDRDQPIGEVKDEIVNLMADIQALSHGLHPPRLDLLGLEKAAAGFCAEVSARHGLTIDVHFDRIPASLPKEVYLCFYRVLQEALQNVVKHSGSDHADVALSGQVDLVTMTIQDRGAGFELQQAMRGSGLGLTSMRERLKVIGGQLSVESQRGRGTTIRAVAPCRLASPPR
jgi:signal transduction histidine kinase